MSSNNVSATANNLSATANNANNEAQEKCDFSDKLKGLTGRF